LISFHYVSHRDIPILGVASPLPSLLSDFN
jgi:hypothetical protein